MKTYKTIRKIFDKDNVRWVNDQESNLWYLKSREGRIVDYVKIHGWASLNDAYDFLGFPRTMEGQKLGWTMDTIQGDVFNVYCTDGDPDLIIVFRGLTELF